MLLYFGIAPNTYTSFYSKRSQASASRQQHSVHFSSAQLPAIRISNARPLNFDIFHIVATLVLSLRLRGRNPHLFFPGFFPRQARKKIGLFFVYKRSRRVKGLRPSFT